MEYSGILSLSTNPLIIISATLILLSCICLYWTLSRYIIERVMEKIFSLTNHLQNINRSVIYCLLMSFPTILLGIISISYNHSLVGIQISCNLDEIHLFLVSGYICWIQQSRQTPLRGFIFIRDMVFVLLAFGLICKFYYDGQYSIYYGILFAPFYIIYYITQLFTTKLQGIINHVFSLKQDKSQNCLNLLTQKNHQIGNFLTVGNIVQTKKLQINNFLLEFKEMLNLHMVDEEQERIQYNFAKVFLTILEANRQQQIQSFQRNKMKSIDDWDEGSENSQQQNNQDNQIEQPKNNQDQLERQMKNSGNNDSANGLFIHKTTKTSDFVIQQDSKQQNVQLSIPELISRYSFYPIYWLSLTEGQVKLFVEILSIFLLFLCMFLLSNVAHYFQSISLNNISLTSLIISVGLVYPSGSYYLRISAENDFDFLNIFLQSTILKLTVFGLSIAFVELMVDSQSQYGIQYLMLISLRALNYLLFTIFLISQKLATRYTNFKIYVGMFIISQLSRIVIELVIQNS